jgi:hypothetical protein
MTTTIDTPEQQLSRLFGSYRAEWLSERLFDLYSEPAYWPELLTERPCILVGGRGTGKTTVLRALSYEGQYRMHGGAPSAIDSLRFIGFYSRVDTNRVRAFRGHELSEDGWISVFAHYLNLAMAASVLEFATWYGLHKSNDLFDASTCAQIAVSLNLEEVNSQSALFSRIADATDRLEAEINNIGEASPTGLSMPKAPIDKMMARLNEQLPGRHFFFLIDEYENYSDYQQSVVNTYIKHSDPLFSFKIGVRELGFRVHSTLNPDEQLISPADYIRVSIEERLSGEAFSEFARSVCNGRLSLVGTPTERVVGDIAVLLPGLSLDEEAKLLGVDDAIDRELEVAKPAGHAAEIEHFRASSPLDQLLVLRWARLEGQSVDLAVHDYLADPQKWATRRNNYGYALLFTIWRGRGKRGIQKYYAGWDTIVSLAASNIRYVLELVEQGLLLHLREGGALGEPVSAAEQTQAAIAVGRKNVRELEGLSVHGANLTRLVLGLGRVFQILAADPLGHTPEVNEFELSDPGDGTPKMREADEVDELLISATRHLAVLRRPGTKVAVDALSDTRDYDYRLHPIFAPYFVFSHRAKRKLSLSGKEVLGLVKDPRATIRAIVTRQNRSAEAELPEQLRLFAAYFTDDA